jgi:hypothetical protein
MARCDRVVPPPPAPLRSFLAERGEFDRVDERHRTASAGRPPSPGLSPPNCRGERRTSIALRTLRLASNLPRQFRGRWAGGAGPEGACAGTSEAHRPQPYIQPPPVCFGGGASLSERRGRRGSRESLCLSVDLPIPALTHSRTNALTHFPTAPAPPPRPRSPACRRACGRWWSGGRGAWAGSRRPPREPSPCRRSLPGP